MNDDTIPSDSHFPDELISAYLDDELTPEEKLRVEEQLMDSVEHRQLFEELKSLRQNMQSLPTQSLDQKFAARVLERAEKQLLTDKEEGPSGDKTVSAPPVYPTHEQNTWRGLVWSVSAMAAAIMLIVLSPWMAGRRHDPNPVAVVERQNETEKATANQAEGKTETSKNLAADRNTQHPELSDLAKQEQASQNSQLSGVGQTVRDDRSDSSPQVNDSLTQQRLAAAEDQIAENQRRNKGAVENGLEQDGQPLSNHAFANRQRPDTTTPQAPIQPGNASAGFKQPPASGNIVAAESSGATPAIAGGQGQDASFGGSTKPAGNGVPSENALASRMSKFAPMKKQHTESVDALQLFTQPNQQRAGGATTDMMVISVDVTREALRAHFMDELLAKHQIDSQSAPDELAQAKLQQTPSELKSNADEYAGAKSKRQQGDQAESEQGSEQRGGLKLDEGEGQSAANDPSSALRRRTGLWQKDAKRAYGDGDVDVVVVVATPSQVEGLLNDMQQRSEEVLAMAYDRPASPVWNIPKQDGLADSADKARRDRVEKLSPADSKLEGDRATTRVTEREAMNEEQPAARKMTEEQAKYRFENNRSEDYRGIARRLQLPEDFQKSLNEPYPSKPAGRIASAPARAADAARPVNDQDALGKRSSQAGQQGRKEGGEKTGENEYSQGTPPLANLDRADLTDAKAAEVEAQPLVRVLFVLRAAAPTPLADQPAAGPAPASAALREEAGDQAPAEAIPE